MRDLGKERPSMVGTLDLDDAPGPDGHLNGLGLDESVRLALREARQDRQLATIAGLIDRAAQALDPLTRIVVNRVLAFLGVGAASVISYKALVLTPRIDWPQVAVVGLFILLCGWLVRRST